MIEEAGSGCSATSTRCCSGQLPMAARVVPDAKQRFRGEFDHLARTDEWLVQEDEEYI